MATITDTSRFQDKNVRISDFEDEIFVVCPKCQKRAVVTKDEPGSYFSERTLKCPNCFFSQKGRHHSFIVKLNTNCLHCNAEITVNMKNVNKKKENITVRCPNCDKTGSYTPTNETQVGQYQYAGNPTDGYFGLPLWLTSNFRGNNFCAYNYAHLNYLRQYIAADLRERNERTHWTMVEKLPDWMKSAKNRDKLIKLITELETK